MFKSIKFALARNRAFLDNYKLFKKMSLYKASKEDKKNFYFQLNTLIISISFYGVTLYYYRPSYLLISVSLTFFTIAILLFYTEIKKSSNEMIKRIEFSFNEIYEMIIDGVDLNINNLLLDLNPSNDNVLRKTIHEVATAKYIEENDLSPYFSFNESPACFKPRSFIERKNKIEDILKQSNNIDLFNCYNRLRAEKQRNIFNYLKLIEYIQGNLNTINTKFFRDETEVVDDKVKENKNPNSETHVKKGLFSKTLNFFGLFPDNHMGDDIDNDIYLLSDYNKNIEKMPLEIRKTEKNLRNVIKDINHRENEIEALVISSSFDNGSLGSKGIEAIQSTDALLTSTKDVARI